MTAANAQFLLLCPPSLGSNAELQGNEPCGGAPVEFNGRTSPSINISATAMTIEVTTLSTESEWQFRATIDQREPFHWMNLLENVSQTGIGDFCVPAMCVPESFIGKTGLVQVIQHGSAGTAMQVCWFFFRIWRPCTNPHVVLCRQFRVFCSCCSSTTLHQSS